MDVAIVAGVGGALVSACLPLLKVPRPFAAAGVAIGVVLIGYGIVSPEMRPTTPQLALYALGLAAITGAGVWQLQTKKAVTGPAVAEAVIPVSTPPAVPPQTAGIYLGSGTMKTTGKLKAEGYQRGIDIEGGHADLGGDIDLKGPTPGGPRSVYIEHLEADPNAPAPNKPKPRSKR